MHSSSNIINKLQLQRNFIKSNQILLKKYIYNSYFYMKDIYLEIVTETSMALSDHVEIMQSEHCIFLFFNILEIYQKIAQNLQTFRQYNARGRRDQFFLNYLEHACISSTRFIRNLIVSVFFKFSSFFLLSSFLLLLKTFFDVEISAKKKKKNQKMLDKVKYTVLPN